jgi:NAD+ diphosphatase
MQVALMQFTQALTFGGSGLDRAAHLRGDCEKQRELWARGRVIAFWHGQPLTRGAELYWLGTESPALAQVDISVFLGLDDGQPCFAADLSCQTVRDTVQPSKAAVSNDASNDEPFRHPSLPQEVQSCELRAIMAGLSPREAEMAATGKALLHWHRTHGFCSACGAASAPVMAGWQRQCPACGSAHFPRTDPVVIMLITRGNSLLLGRNSAWPEAMYSLLAGFVEPGETVEAAVRREVFEETAIKVGAVRYLASQPWPFPASLMIGCLGEALSSEISIDPVEISDARWLSREEVAHAVAGGNPALHPPRHGSVARFLIEAWLADRWR